MMNHRISGTFHQASPARVEALLDAWLGGTTHRARLFGHTWEHRTDTLQVHVETCDADAAKYWLDVRMSGTREACAALAERLVWALDAAKIVYLVDRFEVDEHELQLEDEVTYAHPDFDTHEAREGDVGDVD